MVSVRLVLPGSGAGDCRAPLPATLASLRAAAERHFGAELRGKVGLLEGGSRSGGPLGAATPATLPPAVQGGAACRRRRPAAFALPCNAARLAQPISRRSA